MMPNEPEYVAIPLTEENKRIIAALFGHVTRAVVTRLVLRRGLTPPQIMKVCQRASLEVGQILRAMAAPDGSLCAAVVDDPDHDLLGQTAEAIINTTLGEPLRN